MKCFINRIFLFSVLAGIPNFAHGYPDSHGSSPAEENGSGTLVDSIPMTPPFDESVMPNFDSVTIDIPLTLPAHPEGERLIGPGDDGSEGIEARISAIFSDFRAGQETLEKIDRVIAENTTGDPNSRAVFIRIKNLQGSDPSPHDDQMRIEEAALMEAHELAHKMREEKTKILSDQVTEWKHEIEGDSVSRFDTSRENQLMAFVRVGGIMSLSVTVGVWVENSTLSRAWAKTVLPGLVSAWLMFSKSGWLKWSKVPEYNPFTANLGDFEAFQRSRLLKLFPLNLVKKVPLPFVDPAPGVAIPQDRQISAFSPRASIKMFGFLVSYLSVAHLSSQIYDAWILDQPHLASLANWYTISDLKNIAIKSLFAFPAELLTARLIGDVADRYDIRVAERYKNGEIDYDTGRERIKSGIKKISYALAGMSIVNSMTQIRLATSDFDFYGINDGHVMVIGMALGLGVVYKNTHKLSGLPLLAQRWSDGIKSFYRRNRARVEASGIFHAFGGFSRDDHNDHDDPPLSGGFGCPGSFLHP